MEDNHESNMQKDELILSDKNIFGLERDGVVDYINQSHLLEEDLYVEDYHLGIKALYALVGLTSGECSIIAIVTLRRTKRIPENAKFLSTALLVFDFMFISLSSVRKFVLDPFYNTTMNVATTTCIQLAYITIGMMALERFCVFYRPMKYMRVATSHFVKTIATCVWITMVVTFQTVRYPVCYMKFRSMNVFYEAGICNQIVTIYYAGLVIIVLATSMICYLRIFWIVKQKHNSTSKPVSFNSAISALRSFKTTSLVLIYILVIFCTSVAYSVIIFYIRWKNLGVTTLRLSLEITTILNCIFDPFLYVLWFRECRMELLKILAPCNQRVQDRVAKMKIDIFNIVVTPTPIHTSSQELTA